MHCTVHPSTYVALKLPSDTTKILQAVPNTTISLGKYGSFQANQIIGRPYHLTFEILDQPEEADGHALRVVPADELHAEALITGEETPAEQDDGDGIARELLLDGTSTIRTNRDIVDDSSSQRMTFDEIEALKKDATDAGKEIIAKLLRSHSALDQKTAFSLAKYTLKKKKKFLKRFTVLPLDVPLLIHWMLEQKDPLKSLELRDEMIGLIGCWANVHHGGDAGSHSTGRWLIIDDTGGLVVAAMAERMGILYTLQTEHEIPEDEAGWDDDKLGRPSRLQSKPTSSARRVHLIPSMSAKNSTLTMIHPHSQPNLSLLKYFSFDINDPTETHPLHTALKTLSWMQLLAPESDPIYAVEPPIVPESTLATWRPSKRGMYHRKRRRWARVRSVVDETRAGGFDGLIVASLMDPASILKHTVPLLTGSAPVVVYSPHIEPLVKLADLYSTARKAAFIHMRRVAGDKQTSWPKSVENQDLTRPESRDEDWKANIGSSAGVSELDFPVDPTLLLAPTIQTSRVRTWQVLPGRTHPLMIGRGGAEGYVFHGIRVLPAEGPVEARGRQGRKKRKTASTTLGIGSVDCANDGAGPGDTTLKSTQPQVAQL